MSVLFACAGHLLIDLPLFGLPIVLLAGAVTWIVRADRRREQAESASDGGRVALAGDDLLEELGELSSDPSPGVMLAGDRLA